MLVSNPFSFIDVSTPLLYISSGLTKLNVNQFRFSVFRHFMKRPVMQLKYYATNTNVSDKLPINTANTVYISVDH